MLAWIGKKLSDSSADPDSSSSKPNFEPPQNAVRQIKGVWFALQSTYGTLKFPVDSFGEELYNVGHILLQIHPPVHKEVKLINLAIQL